MNKLINYSKQTLDKREKNYRKKDFKIKFSTAIRDKSINGIINKLYNNRSNSTLNLNNKLHCRRGARRSITDGYLLCLYYIPDTSFYNFYTELKKRYDYSKTKYLKSNLSYYHDGFSFCDDIRQLVFDYRFKIKKAPTN